MRRHFSGIGCGPCGRGHVPLALGRPRDTARAPLRALCEELAALAPSVTGGRGFKKRGPGLMAGYARQHPPENAAVERREADASQDACTPPAVGLANLPQGVD